MNLPGLIAFCLMAWQSSADPLKPDPDEPLRMDYSLQAADVYLADAAQSWTNKYQCISCHTNGLYLMAGAMEPAGKPWDETRAFALDYLDAYINEIKTPNGQYGAVEGIVATACFLALGDSIRYGTLSPETMLAMDYAISLQDEAGNWPRWLACNWPPYESDTHFGVTLMAIVIGRAPNEYRAKPHVKLAFARLQSWLTQHPPETMHQKAMMLWAEAENGTELDPAIRSTWVSELMSLQQEDGGWSMASLGNWPRRDGTPQLATSEAYPTAFCIWVLRRGGIKSESDEIQRAVAWLQHNQRESGRWFSRSQRADTRHYLSNASTNMATIALRAAAPSVVRLRFNSNVTKPSSGKPGRIELPPNPVQSEGKDQSQ